MTIARRISDYQAEKTRQKLRFRSRHSSAGTWDRIQMALAMARTICVVDSVPAESVRIAEMESTAGRKLSIHAITSPDIHGRRITSSEAFGILTMPSTTSRCILVEIPASSAVKKME
ncbi:MAG: hypothetical protein AAB229_02900 [Candidatus Hydrogenedentota bacterium]